MFSPWRYCRCRRASAPPWRYSRARRGICCPCLLLGFLLRNNLTFLEVLLFVALATTLAAELDDWRDVVAGHPWDLPPPALRLRRVWNRVVGPSRGLVCPLSAVVDFLGVAIHTELASAGVAWSTARACVVDAGHSAAVVACIVPAVILDNGPADATR